MSFLNKYTIKSSYTIENSKENVIAYLVDNVKQCSFSDDLIVISLKPTFLNATGGRGIIRIKIFSGKNERQTILNSEIIPTSFTIESLYAVAFLFIVWIIVGLLISTSYSTILTIIVGWCLLVVSIHFILKLNLAKMEMYLSNLVYQLNRIPKLKG